MADRLPARAPQPLDVATVRAPVDAAVFGVETTAEIADPEPAIGQDRARAALAFALAMDRIDYSVFVLGPPGVGRLTTVRRLLNAHAATRQRPGDWLYVHNHKEPTQPLAATLPAGEGRRFCLQIGRLAEDLRAVLASILDGEAFRAGLALLPLFVEAGLCASNGEGRRHMKAGALKINDDAVSDPERLVGPSDLTAEGVVKLSVGKKKHALARPV